MKFLSLKPDPAFRVLKKMAGKIDHLKNKPMVRFKQFETFAGLKGLLFFEKDRLEILAVEATKPGTGQFRDFIIKAKAEYQEIAIFEVWNGELEKTLIRYGFEKVSISFVKKLGDTPDSIISGYLWKRETNDPQ